MAKKTFALEMNGIEIKTLEDLQNNFELEKIVAYFKSGELLDWLNDRFYDDEAEKIENISPDDKNLSQKICVALNVECDEDLEFTQRIREKKKILEEKTDDENIIDNATTTALNQDDLANLLHMDYKKIFLCGENFTVPIRVENKKYIGVLSTPKIKIKANSQEELDAKNISFENCILPYEKSKIDELKTLEENFFHNNGKWYVVNGKKEVCTFDELSKEKKSIALKLVCQGKYQENQIIYMRLLDDLTAGIALTTDSFCSGGIIGNKIIEYKDIQKVDITKYTSGSSLCYDISIKSTDYVYGGIAYNDYKQSAYNTYNEDEKNSANAVKSLFQNDDSIKKFLEVVKNF